MNKKIILLSALTVSIASASYMVQFNLDPKFINLDTPDEITGVIEFAPQTINRGESTALNWNYNYLKSLKVSSTEENFEESTYFGSYPLSPLKTTSYNIILDNNKKIEEKILKLTVIQPTPVVNFTADKTKIGEGQSSKLTWNVSDAESATLENTGITGLSSSYTVSPTNDTTYKLNVTGFNNENNTSKSISIDVVKDSTISSFTSDKTKVSIGDNVNFSWTTNDSEGLELIPFGTVDKSTNSKSITMNTTGDFTYSLKTTSFSGTTKTSNPIIVSVYGLPTIGAITAPTVINYGSAFTLSWSGTNIANYTVKGNVAASGVPVAGVARGNTASLAITPQAAGTYNYTVTGMNAAGVNAAPRVSANVKVEQWVAIASTYTGWANSSGFYNCSAFSPAASEINAGTGFYQTQYCYLNQSRTRQDRIQEVATGEVRNTSAVTESQTLTNQPNTQYAIGTKPTIVCRYDSGNQWQIVVVGGAQSLVNVVWNGGTKATSPQYAGSGAINITQITGWDGKSYTRGPQVTGQFYQACSTP